MTPSLIGENVSIPKIRVPVWEPTVGEGLQDPASVKTPTAGESLQKSLRDRSVVVPMAARAAPYTMGGFDPFYFSTQGFQDIHIY